MDHRAFDELLRRRRQVLSLSDAQELGMTHKALAAAARRWHLGRPARGVILGPGCRHSFEQATRIAVARVGGSRVLVSREASAYLTGLVKQRPDVIELVVPANRGRPALDELKLPIDDEEDGATVSVQVWRSRTLRAADVLDVDGVPVTCPARTLLDLAAATDIDDLRSLVIDARQRRLASLSEIAKVHDRIPRYPGRPKVTRILADLDEQVCDSRLEWNFRGAARVRGFTPYPAPFPFRCSDGVTVALDVAFPEQWVCVECDGLSSRADRRSLSIHHLRQNQAVLDGWRPFLVDWTRLKHDADALFAELSALLATDPGRPPAPMGDPALVGSRVGGRRHRFR